MSDRDTARIGRFKEELISAREFVRSIDRDGVRYVEIRNGGAERDVTDELRAQHSRATEMYERLIDIAGGGRMIG